MPPAAKAGHQLVSQKSGKNLLTPLKAHAAGALSSAAASGDGAAVQAFPPSPSSPGNEGHGGEGGGYVSSDSGMSGDEDDGSFDL